MKMGETKEGKIQKNEDAKKGSNVILWRDWGITRNS
jgi:hypothetical protein